MSSCSRAFAGLFFCLAVIGFAGTVSFAYESNWTIRVDPSIDSVIAGPAEGVVLWEDDEFDLSVNVTCMNASCGSVYLQPVYCRGEGCRDFEYIDDIPGGLYSKTRVEQKRLIVGEGEVFRGLWHLKARKSGVYTLLVMIDSTYVGRSFTQPLYVTVYGCGDGNCTDGETYLNCPVDCCEPDCSGFGDAVCHSTCDKFNGCAMSKDCDGRAVNESFCFSTGVSVSCCSVGAVSCDFGAFCISGTCFNCSRECDRFCESVACYKFDPDCDGSGNAVLPCCGNNVVEEGEECDGNISNGCALNCTEDCKCPMDPMPTPKIVSFNASTTVAALRTTSTVPATTVWYTFNVTTSTVDGSFPGGDFSGLWVFGLLGLFFVVLAGVVLLILRSVKRRRALAEYRVLRDREREVVESLKRARADYAAGRIGVDDAGELIHNYNKELARLDSEICAVLRRAGKD